MRQEIDTIIFDLDGTIYQNTEFHRDYLHFLVEGTAREGWVDSLIAFADAVFVGERLVMNAFYDASRIEASTPAAYFAALERALLPELTYEEALARADCLYTGDAWAVVTLMGQTLGLLDNGRGDAVYRRTRDKMSADGMTGCLRLRRAIQGLEGRCETILLSNSYESTAMEFLQQLGFEHTFQKFVFSANKPAGMVQALCAQDAALLDRPERVLSVGDHAFNDLLPLRRLGVPDAVGQPVLQHPYAGVRRDGPHAGRAGQLPGAAGGAGNLMDISHRLDVHLTNRDYTHRDKELNRKERKEKT